MLAIIGVVLAVIAGILELVNKHTSWAVWPLLIIAVILIGVDVAYGWHRAGPGYYRRGGTTPVA